MAGMPTYDTATYDTATSEERIVRTLAAVDPVRECGGFLFCGVCSAGLNADGEPHEPDCPWRLAVEWVAAWDAMYRRPPDEAAALARSAVSAARLGIGERIDARVREGATLADAVRDGQDDVSHDRGVACYLAYRESRGWEV